MLILAFDTSGPYCAAALLLDGTLIETRAEDMAKGQGEYLIPFLQTLLGDHGYDWSDLTRIGVGTGPGNFTGIRIAVSAARGLALGLGIPAVGVSAFDAIHLDAPGALAAVPAPRDHVYLRRPGQDPQHLPRAMADALGPLVLPPDPAGLAGAIARGTALATPGQSPKPMYVKPADAAPSRDAAPVIL